MLVSSGLHTKWQNETNHTAKNTTVCKLNKSKNINCKIIKSMKYFHTANLRITTYCACIVAISGYNCCNPLGPHPFTHLWMLLQRALFHPIIEFFTCVLRKKKNVSKGIHCKSYESIVLLHFIEKCTFPPCDA